MGCAILDTVLGLSLTSTNAGWVLVGSQDADGTTLACDEFSVPQRSHGVGARDTSAQATAIVSRLQALVQDRGQRLRGIGVTWSGTAAAEAALAVESLTDAGFDNVVPVRFGQAAGLLASGLGPIAKSDQAAVCIVEPDSATVVWPGSRGGDESAVARHPIGDDNDLVDWLTTLFTLAGARPGLLVVAGSGAGLEELAARLGGRLSVPVFAQACAQLALARAVALIVGAGPEFANMRPDQPLVDPGAGPVRRRTLSYTGALAMLVAGVLTLVASLAAAVSLRLVPSKDLQAVEGVATNAPTTPTPSSTTPRHPPAEVPETPEMAGSLWESASGEGPAAAPVTLLTPHPSGPAGC